MTAALTIEVAEARISELAAALIKQIRDEAPRFAHVAEAKIPLRAGEHFRGVVLDENGAVDHYVIQIQTDDKKRNFNDNLAYVKGLGGDAPSPNEGHLLMANARATIKSWFWLNKEENASSAWCCGSNGGQTVGNRSSEGSGLAVRRVFPSDL